MLYFNHSLVRVVLICNSHFSLSKEGIETLEQGVINVCQLLASIANVKLSEHPFKTSNRLANKKIVAQFAKHHKCSLSLNALSFSKLTEKKLPLAFQSKSGDFYILAKLSKEQGLVQRCTSGAEPKIISLEELQQLWSNTVIRFTKSEHKFDIRWFIPEFVRFRRLFSEILFFSFFIQLLALALPLFFQVVMDKVLVHQALSTLDVLIIALVVVGLFEVLLTGLREYLLAHTTTRIDIRLGAKLFKHLLGLPLLYFKSRQIGAIVTRVRELDSIRELLTGAALVLLVDVSFTFVFFAVMYYLSPLLTYIVLASVPVYALIAYLSSEPLRKRIIEQFQKSAQNTAFLTESIQGVETMKSLALEPSFQRRWNGQVKEVAETNFKQQTLQNTSSHAVMLLQKVTTIGVIWVGAGLVMDLQLTIGQLIAFNMMVSHVSQPMAKLVSLWQQFIQTRVAVDNLGDMLNMPIEHSSGDASPKNAIKGDIKFQQVHFRYQADSPTVLKGINFHIRAGEHIGIVGPSGSGKSTLTRLLQKLYQAEAGNILIDETPLKHLPVDYLRRQMGVVLQENELFNRSVRKNIALRMPAAHLDKVVQAAKLAGAHDFILKLPLGYDTIITEGGHSLSGGQRQRLAIARALISAPRILIFDEATSALDEESQQIIQQNMKKIIQGRTVITVAHRLSTVQQCDRIMVIENGQLTEIGHHNDLINQDGCYQRLWSLQQDFQHPSPQAPQSAG